LCAPQVRVGTTAGRTPGPKRRSGTLREASSASKTISDRYSVMRAEDLKRQLCNIFCGSIDVRPVPSGLAISSAFEDSSGDPIGFYVTASEDGFQIEDDGAYLSHLIAKDIP